MPLFGTLSIDDSPTSASPVVLYNGDYYSTQVVMLFFYGEIKFKFYSGTVLGADSNVNADKKNRYCNYVI